MGDEPTQDKPVNAPAPDVRKQIREEFAARDEKGEVNRLLAEYQGSLKTEREKRLFVGMLRAIQQEAGEKGVKIGEGGQMSIKDAFNLAYKEITGYDYGEAPPEEEPKPEDKPKDKPAPPPGKQAVPQPGVKSFVDDDPMPEPGEMPLEDLNMYVDVRTALRDKTKRSKSDAAVLTTVEDTITQLLEDRKQASQ